MKKILLLIDNEYDILMPQFVALNDNMRNNKIIKKHKKSILFNYTWIL